MSKKTKKDTNKDGKADKASRKSPAKAKPSAESNKAKAAAEASKAEKAGKETVTPSAGEQPVKPPSRPLVVSNFEERGISRMLFSLLLVTVVAAGGFATQPLWSPYVVDYLPGLKGSTQDKLPESSLAARLGEIEEEVTRMRQGGEAIADLERQRGKLNKSFEGVMARIIELEKRIDDVRTLLQATSSSADTFETSEILQRLSSRMNTLETSDMSVDLVLQRLAKLEQAMADSGTDASTEQQVRTQTLMLAVSNLREALRSNAPFAPALGALKTLANGDQNILRQVDELAPYANGGIATIATLRRDYIAVAKSIAAAQPEAAKEDQSEDVFDDALKTIKSLVTIRKVSAPTLSDDPKGPAQQAMARLDAGDLGGAVDIVSALSGQQAAAAAPWLDSARGRLAAEAALSKLHVLVFSLLTPVSK